MYDPSPMKFGVHVDPLLNGVHMDFCSPLKFLTLSTQQRHSDYVTNIVCESQVVRKSKGDENERTSNKESTTL
jgi:hypothetical protein